MGVKYGIMSHSEVLKALCAFKKTPEYTNRVLYRDPTHGIYCDPAKCSFWRYNKSSIYVCKRSGESIHICGQHGECQSMCINESGEGYVCKFTGIMSAQAVEMVWGVDQHPCQKNCRTARKPTLNDKDRMPTIRKHVAKAIEVYLNDSAARLKIVASRRAEIIRDRAVAMDCGSKLSDIVGKFYQPNKCLFEPVTLTPARRQWLITTISDYMFRLVGSTYYTSRKKIYAFVATCLLRLEEGCVDPYDIVVFPRVPWLEGMFTASDVGRTGDIKCGVQEKMWTEMQRQTGLSGTANPAKIFQQSYTEDIPC